MNPTERLSHVIDYQNNNHRFKRDGGWIYFVRCNEFVKVGIAKGVSTRLSMMQTGCPYPLTLLAVLPTANAKRDETLLHEVFKQYHERGEWFRLPDELVKLVMLLCADSRSFKVIDDTPVKKTLPRSKRWLAPGWQAYGVRA